MKRLVGILVAVVAVVVLFSCGDDDEPHGTTAATGVFTGRVGTTEALIGITMGKANVVAWVCDGANGIALQFTTPRLGDGFDVTLPSGYRLAGLLDAERLDGALSGPSGSVPFRAELAHPEAGVWTTPQSAGDDPRRIWIVLNDRTQQGAIAGPAGVTTAPRLDPGTGKADGLQAARSNPAGSQISQQFGGGFSGGGFSAGARGAGFGGQQAGFGG